MNTVYTAPAVRVTAEAVYTELKAKGLVTSMMELVDEDTSA